MRRIWLLCFLLCFSCSKKESGTSDQQAQTSTADAVSGASVDTQEWLPEPGLEYKVLGYNPGLKGVLIQYSDDMYRGGDMLSVDGVKLLKSRGIKTVYSVTPSEAIRSYCTSYGIELQEYVFDYQGLSDQQAKQFITSLDSVEYPIYIHCHSGKQRGGNLGVLYRIFKEHWSFEKAFKEYEVLGGKPDADKEMLTRLYETLGKDLQ